MRKDYEVVIIGGGMGGLAAGVFLCKKGLRVLILEQNNYVGGYCSSFRRGKFIFDSAAHVIGSSNKGYSFGNLLDDLHINVDLIKLSPIDRIHIGDEKIVEISSDWKEYEDFLLQKFSGEYQSIKRFFEELYKMTNPLYAAAAVRKYSGITYQAYLDMYFKSKILKGMLSIQCGFIGLPPNKASALSALFTLKMFIIEGTYYPRGGAQKLADAFMLEFKNKGGELLLNTKAKQVLLKDNKVVGVEVNDGRIFGTNVVISNIDCKKTYTKLIDGNVTNVGDKVRSALNNYRESMSCFMIYLGTNNNVKTEKKNGWYYPSLDINNIFAELIYLHIPSNYDNSVTSEGGNVIIMVAPYTKKRCATDDWVKIKEELSGFYMKKLEKIFNNLVSNIVMKDAATPYTLERYTSNSSGACYGWEQSPSQTYLRSFPVTSDIEGLYITGHWTFPGGGVVSTAFSGINTSRQVLKTNHFRVISYKV